jgi:hypothetical protein
MLSASLINKIDKNFELPDGSEQEREIVRQIFEPMKQQALSKFDTFEKLMAISYEVALRGINSGIGILSLSGRWNSALMWSHYTYSYAGFCVGFNRSHDYFKGLESGTGNRSCLMPVKYCEDRFFLPDENLSDEDVDNILLTKSVDWDYEKEERMISVLHIANKRNEKSPYPVDLFEIPSEAISEIIVGGRASEELIEKARSRAQDLNVKLYKTRTSFASFDVEKVEIQV